VGAAVAITVVCELTGAGIVGGDPSQSCSIWQNGHKLGLTNQTGQTADGWIDGPNHVMTNWSGMRIGGSVTHHRRRIDWDNGTYWSR
jgi:hypothetical protein